MHALMQKEKRRQCTWPTNNLDLSTISLNATNRKSPSDVKRLSDLTHQSATLQIKVPVGKERELIRLVIWQIFTGRIELFQQAPIGGVKDAIFCPCSVFVVVFAEELELVQSAKTKCLSEQEK